MTGNAAISNANFRNVGMATGTASAMYFLGLGSSSSSDGLILDAKKNLYAQTEIQSGQALANVTVDVKIKFFIFWVEQTATVSADIIDFNKPEDFTEFSEIPMLNSHKFIEVSLKEHREKNTNLYEKFATNDIVFYAKSHSKAGKIISFKDGLYKLELRDGNGVVSYISAQEKELFYTKRFKRESFYGIEDKVFFNDPKGRQINGKIIGVGSTHYKVYASINKTVYTIKQSDIID